MAYTFTIGRRTVLSRENRLLVNLTTLIAVAGVALGVAALIVVNAVYDGYIGEIQGRFISFLSHLDVQDPVGHQGRVRGDADFLNYLEEQDGVVAAAPVLIRQALLMPRRALNGRRVGCAVFGIDVDRTRRVSQMLDSITEGIATPGPGEMVLGSALAERLGVTVGDNLVLLSDFETTEERPSIETHPFTVVGIFRSGFYQFDESFAYTSMEGAREAFDIPGRGVDLIQIKLDDPWHPEIAARRLQALPELRGLIIRTWRDRNAAFIAGVELTRVVLLVMLLLLVAVASTNVIGSLVMIVHDRTREIGIIRAMGATRRGVLGIYVLCGLFIGVLGVIVGVVIALGVCAALSRWELIDIPETVYFIDRLPITITWSRVGLIAIATVAICLVASVIPAIRASRLDPVEALREE